MYGSHITISGSPNHSNALLNDNNSLHEHTRVSTDLGDKEVEVTETTSVSQRPIPPPGIGRRRVREKN